MRMQAMDSIRGAKELALLLEERHGVTPEAEPPAPLMDGTAAPVFHWLGIEPPPAPLEVPRTGRGRRLKRYLRWRSWA
jgi:hypothetical protein